MAAEGWRVAPVARSACGPHFAFVRLQRPGSVLPAHDTYPPWLAVCQRLATRLERVSASSVLLDLGHCTDDEAWRAVQLLLARLTDRGLPARAGIGPSGCLAHMVLLCAPALASQRLISPADAPGLFQNAPVVLLSRVCFAETITPAVIERLHRYGLRTLGQVARLGELALRRQFGPHIGPVLAALAAGRDPRPLLPTPPPPSLRVRLRIPGGSVEAEQIPDVLKHFAKQVARHLHEMSRHAGTLQLAVRWDTGAWQQVMHTLRQPTCDPALILDALQRLLVPLLIPTAAIADLHMTLLDFAPMTLEQAAFWRPRAQRQAALDVVADTLTRRHGKHLLLSLRLTAPDTVFPEERYALAHGLATPDTAATLPLADPQYLLPRSDGLRDGWHDVPQRLHWW